MSNEIKTLTQEETAETKAPAHLPVLTVEKDEELMTEKELQDIKWHELKNAYISKKILSGTLSGLETTPNDHRTIGIVYYSGFKISIPAAELIRLNSSGGDTNTRMEKIISSMIGVEISFMILAIDNSSRSVIASRLKANEKNIRTFYFDKNEQGRYKIYEGSIVEARITGVSSTSIRVEIFGAECNIQPAELSWDFIANAHDKYAIGEKVMVKVTSICGRDNEEEPFQITASIRQAEPNRQAELIGSVTRNCIYTGEVVDIRKGTYLIKLSNGLNALAHSSHCKNPVMRKDTVAYVVKYIDDKNYTVIGNIIRVIKPARRY